MRAICHALAWAPALLASLVAVAQAAPVCEVAALSGEAKSGGQALKVGDKLEAGAEVTTSAKGRMRLRCVDGSSIVLGDGTTLKLAEFKPAADGQPRAATLVLSLGVIGQKVAPGGSWEVRTPSAVTAVRGTEFLVEVSGEQATAVLVQTGEVAVEGTAKTRGIGPRKPIQLNPDVAGTQCSVAGGCAAAAAWTPERIRAMQDKLTGI
jgi:hypothetical protein